MSGWVSAEDEVSLLLKQMKIKILALQETWLKAPLKTLSFSGYQWFGSQSPSTSSCSRGSGGIAFLVDEKLARFCSYSCPYKHGRIGVLKYSSGSSDLCFLNIYNFTSNDADEQDNVLSDLSLIYQSQTCPTFILGDFNAWIGTEFGGGFDKLNSSGTSVVALCKLLQLVPVNATPLVPPMHTYDPAATMIDFILVPQHIAFKNVVTTPFASSSHNMVICEVLYNVDELFVPPLWKFGFRITSKLLEQYNSTLDTLMNELWYPLVPLVHQHFDGHEKLEFLSALMSSITKHAAASVWSYAPPHPKAKPWWN